MEAECRNAEKPDFYSIKKQSQQLNTIFTRKKYTTLHEFCGNSQQFCIISTFGKRLFF